jgi:hypothetical protein
MLFEHSTEIAALVVVMAKATIRLALVVAVVVRLEQHH